MAFFITGTVFANESSQGFRRFEIADQGIHCRVIQVQDFKAVAPFDGVTNHPTLLILKRDGGTPFPIPYTVWQPAVVDGRPRRAYPDALAFREEASYAELLAAPVPGSDAGPWLKGTAAQHELWAKFLDASSEKAYRARKGITTDRNGIFFVKTLGLAGPDLCEIENDPSIGRSTDIPRIRATVETEHLFPLLRGRGVKAFQAVPDSEYSILMPQRGMHGDPNFPVTAPRTFRFLMRFENVLKQRSSFRRFQKGQVFWSLWSTGAYTFSEYKVVWKEMSGSRFCAAYVGRWNSQFWRSKVVVPDHKLYFIPVDGEDEAAYLTGLLNASHVSQAVSAYAAQLSLGASVVEYLDIPEFTPTRKEHARVAQLARTITRRGGAPTREDMEGLDEFAAQIFRPNKGGRAKGW